MQKLIFYFSFIILSGCNESAYKKVIYALVERGYPMIDKDGIVNPPPHIDIAAIDVLDTFFTLPHPAYNVRHVEKGYSYVQMSAAGYGIDMSNRNNGKITGTLATDRYGNIGYYPVLLNTTGNSTTTIGQSPMHEDTGKLQRITLEQLMGYSGQEYNTTGGHYITVGQSPILSRDSEDTPKLTQIKLQTAVGY